VLALKNHDGILNGRLKFFVVCDKNPPSSACSPINISDLPNSPPLAKQSIQATVYVFNELISKYSQI
jgi:hypothetical protein